MKPPWNAHPRKSPDKERPTVKGRRAGCYRRDGTLSTCAAQLKPNYPVCQRKGGRRARKRRPCPPIVQGKASPRTSWAECWARPARVFRAGGCLPCPRDAIELVRLTVGPGSSATRCWRWRWRGCHPAARTGQFLCVQLVSNVVIRACPTSAGAVSHHLMTRTGSMGPHLMRTHRLHRCRC